MATIDPNLANQDNSTIDMVTVEDPKSQKPTLCLYWEKFYPPGFLRKVFAEAIATFLLVFMTCGSGGISASDESRVPKVSASIAGGLIVCVMIYAVGHISGAHMNPAVTIAFAATRHFPWKQVPLYAAAQFTGSFCASMALRILLHPIKHIGVTAPSGSDLQALIMEIIVTFCMMFVTLAVATDTKAVGQLAGLAVGSSVCITSILAGPVSGGSMNPARTLGPAIASSYYKAIWVYFVGPVTGTLSGGWCYSVIRETDKPIQVLTPRTLSTIFRRIKSNDEQLSNRGSVHAV